MINYLKHFYLLASVLLIVTCSSKYENPNTLNTSTATNMATAAIGDPFSVNSCGENQTLEVVTKDGWEQIWKEEFDENLNQWKKWKGGAFNNEYQFYNEDKNLDVKNGMLSITPKREFIYGLENPFSNNQKSFNFTSGRIESGIKFSPKGVNYNALRMIARIKTPAGVGMWPAFWAYGDAWPTNGELDIFEQNGGIPNEYSSTYHYGKSVNNDEWIQADLGIYRTSDDLTKCWHVIECIWEKEKITYIIDGKEYFKNTGRNVPNLWDKLENIVFNLAIGGNYVENPPPGNIQLNPMFVDWVRVYSKDIR